jgi:hypothetical protein
VATVADAKTLRWASQGDALTLDPHAQTEGPTTAMNQHVYDFRVYISSIKEVKAIDPPTVHIHQLIVWAMSDKVTIPIFANDSPNFKYSTIK